MKVKVTQEHIDKARAMGGSDFLCETCPIALALREAVGRICHVTPTEAHVPAIASLEKIGNYPLPRSARRFISRFDKGDEYVEPFNFILKGL